MGDGQLPGGERSLRAIGAARAEPGSRARLGW